MVSSILFSLLSLYPFTLNISFTADEKFFSMMYLVRLFGLSCSHLGILRDLDVEYVAVNAFSSSLSLSRESDSLSDFAISITSFFFIEESL